MHPLKHCFHIFDVPYSSLISFSLGSADTYLSPCSFIAAVSAAAVVCAGVDAVAVGWVAGFPLVPKTKTPHTGSDPLAVVPVTAMDGSEESGDPLDSSALAATKSNPEAIEEDSSTPEEVCGVKNAFCCIRPPGKLSKQDWFVFNYISNLMRF